MYDIKATLFLCSVFMFLLCKLISTYVVGEHEWISGPPAFLSDLPKAEYWGEFEMNPPQYIFIRK